MLFRSLIAIAVAGIVALPVASSAADRHTGYQSHVSGIATPHCEDPKVQSRIVSGFRHKARNELHRPDLGIAQIVHIHQNRFEPQKHVDTFTVPRRYCKGTAMLTNGDHRTVWYLIEGGAGFATIGANVEFCVSGFDHWNVYNSYCRVLR